MGSCFSKHSSKQSSRSPDITSVERPLPSATTASTVDKEQHPPTPVAVSDTKPVSHKLSASSPPKEPSPAYGPITLPPAETLKEKSEKHNAQYIMPLNSPKKKVVSSPSKESQKLLPSPAKIVKKTSDDDCSSRKLPSSARKEWLSQAAAATLSNKVATSRNNSFSRDPSPVDASVSRARPSSPLKRSPSMKEGPDAPHLTRSASGKAFSPSRGGFYTSAKTQAEKRENVDEGMKARALHKRSLSKESFADPAAHKRSASRESTAEALSEVRKPSPPKRTPLVVSSSDVGKHNKRSASKEDAQGESRLYSRNSGPLKVSAQDTSSVNLSLRGRSLVRNSNAMSCESENPPANNKNARRKEKSPLRRTCNNMTTLQGSVKIIDRNADLSINSDNLSVCDHTLSKAKDVPVKTRKIGDRLPLREISDNSSFKTRRQKVTDMSAKPRDEVPFQKGTTENFHPRGTHYPTAKPEHQEEKEMMDVTDNYSDHREDFLEARAEDLVVQGSSVLSAFKALEEYRMSLETSKGTNGGQKPTFAGENLGQSLQAGVTQKSYEMENFQHKQDPQRGQSTKRSCEPFLFPDVQSLLMSENEGSMPASISKACSILKAVADLNMGTSIYSRKKEFQDEIEQPNLLSFQFGEGDTQKSNCKQDNSDIYG